MKMKAKIFFLFYWLLGALVGSLIVKPVGLGMILAYLTLPVAVIAGVALYQVVNFGKHAVKALKERDLNVEVKNMRGIIVIIPVITVIAGFAGLLTGVPKMFAGAALLYSLLLWFCLKKGYMALPDFIVNP